MAVRFLNNTICPGKQFLIIFGDIECLIIVFKRESGFCKQDYIYGACCFENSKSEFEFQKTAKQFWDFDIVRSTIVQNCNSKFVSFWMYKK